MPARRTRTRPACSSARRPAGAASTLRPADVVNADGTFSLYGNDSGTAYGPQYVTGGPPAGPTRTAHTFWCYVTNSKIDNSIAKMPGSDATSHFLKASLIPQSQLTPVMAEKMMTAGEVIPAYGKSYAGSLARAKTTWTRLAARHNNGGNVLFLDGHVGPVHVQGAAADHALGPDRHARQHQLEGPDLERRLERRQQGDLGPVPVAAGRHVGELSRTVVRGTRGGAAGFGSHHVSANTRNRSAPRLRNGLALLWLLV